MGLTQYEIFAYQILHYLVVKQNYQIVRVQQHQDDLWLMNARAVRYPVIRISSKSNAGTLSDTEYIRNVHRLILNKIHREGPIIIFNTNPTSTPIHNEIMIQVRMTPGKISNEDITRTFKDIDQIVHEVDDYLGEFATLSKEVEETQLRRYRNVMEKQKTFSVPTLTIGIMIVCIFYFCIVYAFGIVQQNMGIASIVGGAFYKMNIVAANEYWRMFTAGFLHADPISLFVNMYAFYAIGRFSEPIFLKARFLIILIVSIVVGNLFLLIGSGISMAYGLSAGIIGLFGAYLTTFIAHRSLRNTLVKLSLLHILWIMVLVVVFSNISMLGLLGSFICGILFGILFDPGMHWIEMKVHVKIAGSIALLILGYMGVTRRNVDVLNKTKDDTLIRVYRQVGMDWYANYLNKSYQEQYRKE